jgi:hypothetical protein
VAKEKLTNEQEHLDEATIEKYKAGNVGIQ